MTKPSNLKWYLVFRPPIQPPESVSALNFLFTPVIREDSSDFKERVYEAIENKDELLQAVLVNSVLADCFSDLNSGVITVVPLDGYTISRVFTRVEKSLVTGNEQRVKCLEVIDHNGDPLYLYGYKDTVVTTKDSKYKRS